MSTRSNFAEYWKDWYWNKGGREKVQAKRYIAEYNRLKKKGEL